MTDERDSDTSRPVPQHRNDVEGDIEATIDVDPDWIAELRASALAGETGPTEMSTDVESTVDASDELLGAVRDATGRQAHTTSERAAPELGTLPPPPTAPLAPPPRTEAPPMPPTPAPLPSSDDLPAPVAEPAERRWTPAQRLPARSQYSGADTPEPEAPTRASSARSVLIAVIVTAAVLSGAWALFGRGDPSPPPAPQPDELDGTDEPVEDDG